MHSGYHRRQFESAELKRFSAGSRLTGRLIRHGVNQDLAINSNYFEIYPNPSMGNFTIKAIKQMNLNLVNELGQVIKEIQLNDGNNNTVSASNLSSGIYFIVGKNINRKIIVNR